MVNRLQILRITLLGMSACALGASPLWAKPMDNVPVKQSASVSTPPSSPSSQGSESTAKPQGRDSVVKDALLVDVENYLNKLTTIQADFVQIAPDGSLANGRFFLQRPGKMRWQYEPPVPVLMVSAGTFLTFYDYDLDQITNIPIEESLAGFLARPKIELLSKEIKILERTRKNGVVRIRFVQSAKPDDGELTLELSDKPMTLRNLIIKDAQGQTTNVSLNNARYGLPLDNALFVPPSSINKPKREKF
jgi:outer membrane lipoprotein-sorting protein